MNYTALYTTGPVVLSFKEQLLVIKHRSQPEAKDTHFVTPIDMMNLMNLYITFVYILCVFGWVSTLHILTEAHETGQTTTLLSQRQSIHLFHHWLDFLPIPARQIPREPPFRIRLEIAK